MENILFNINDQKITCNAGTTILTAATQNGIYIPTLCFHPDLKPYGACRICLVEDKKSGRLMASCVTPAMQDMVILTDTPRILNHRRNIVRLMMAEHPESCIVCSKGNRCELRKIAAKLGVAEHGLYKMPNYKPFEQINPFITRDLSKCILCGKCIRADHELVVTGAIDYNNRGFRSRPATVHETFLENSNCTFCGTCVSVCPTGALAPKYFHHAGTPERENDSICGFCGAGCSLTIGVSGGQIVEVNPSHYKQTVNGVTLCVRGHFSNDYINSPDRLTHPMIRKKDEDFKNVQVKVSWDNAMETVAAKLSEIKRKHGPQSIAFIGSSKCSNEENYLFQKIARVIFQTSNLINGGYVPGQMLLSYIEKKTYGTCRVTPLSDLKKAQVIFAVNVDCDHTVPVAGYHLKRAAGNGSFMIVMDSERSDLSALAKQWIRSSPPEHLDASNADLINVISKIILKEKAYDKDFVGRYAEGFDSFAESLNALDDNKILRQNGIKYQDLEKTADSIKGKNIAFVIGPDILHNPEGMRTVDALYNLGLLAGSIGKKGCGFYIPVEENNQVGAFDMGVVPDFLPGRRFLGIDENRKILENKWQVKLPLEPGLDMAGFIEAAESGQLKAAYIMGENLIRALPQPKRVEAALGKLEFIVVQDILNNRLAKLADVILPAALFAEKSGSFTNMEGRIQTFAAVVSPPGEAKADWQILSLLAKKMGYPEQYETIEKIRQEIRRVVPMYEGFGNHRQDWIKNNDSKTPFNGNGNRFIFSSVTPKSTLQKDENYPLTARIGTLRFHLGSGTRTSRSKRISLYDKKGEIEISVSDCRKLELVDDKRIRVKSAYGSIEREFKTNTSLPAGHIFIPMAVNSNDVMNLVNLEQIKQAEKSAVDFCQVRIEKL
ncbi:MAG: molybdopterin-dependent oxidoreductase [Pseudomonadota bacterium]